MGDRTNSQCLGPDTTVLVREGKSTISVTQKNIADIECFFNVEQRLGSPDRYVQNPNYDDDENNHKIITINGTSVTPLYTK
jgi:hypothetical protein